MKTGHERNQESSNRLFNSRRPIKSNAYTDGYDAYYNHLDKSDNPYFSASEPIEYQEWERGWKVAEEDYMSRLFDAQEENDMLYNSCRPIKSEYNEFTLSVGEFGQGGTITVTKTDNKWVGSDGKQFMGYLTPEEIVEWYDKDYGSAWLDNSRKPIKAGYDILNVGGKTPAGSLIFYLVNDGKRMPIMTEDYAIREGGYDKDYLYEGSKNGEFIRFDGFTTIVDRLAIGCGLGKEYIDQIEYSIKGNKVIFTVYPTEQGIHLLNNGWWDDYSVKWELSAEEQVPLYDGDEKVAMSVELIILGL